MKFTKTSLSVAISALMLSACGGGGGGSTGPSNTAPTLEGSPASSVVVGNSYSFTPMASDPENDTLSFTVENLPAWAVFDTTTGTIQGTPSDSNVGQYPSVLVSVSDGEFTVALPTFSIEVLPPPNTAPTLSGTPSSTAERSFAYSFTPVATDAENDELEFSVSNLPSWALFDTATGAITGTPSSSDVGSYADIIVSVTDGELSASLPAFSIEVSEVAAVTGKVIDGYIQGALVYLDLNLNYEFDEGEPSAISDATGQYTLYVKPSQIASAQLAPVRAYIGEGAIDLDTNENFTDKPVILSAPPLSSLAASAEDTSSQVTPFTTAITQEIAETLELVINGSVTRDSLELELEAAKSNLRTEYGIDDDAILFGDFLDDQVEESVKQQLAEKAQQRVDELQDANRLREEAKEAAEDGQIVSSGINRKSFVEWHTGELLFLVIEWTKVKTLNEDGSEVIETTETKYFADENYQYLLDEAQEKRVYEVASNRLFDDGDGHFTRTVNWNIDKNGDGEAKFFGKSFQTGTYSEDKMTWTYTEYFDESSPSDDDPSLDDLGRSFDDVDLVNLVTTGSELVGVDMIQQKTEETFIEQDQEGVDHLMKRTTFIEYDPSNPTQATYREIRLSDFTPEVVVHTVDKDWQADGSINEQIVRTVNNAEGAVVESTSNPIWPSRTDDVWQEYADYRWDNGELISYWLEVTHQVSKEDGIEVNVYDGKRYVLDSSTNTKLLDEAGEGLEFNRYHAEMKQIDADTSIEVTSWTHQAIEGYSEFFDDIGQKVVYNTKELDGLWLGHEFAEFQSQDIENLAGSVAALLEAGKSYAEISEADIAGLERYNFLNFTPSFIHDEEGALRTWYVVEKTSDLTTWQQVEFDFGSSDDLVFRVEGGLMLGLYIQGEFCFEEWGGFCRDNVSMPLDAFDTTTGNFETRWGWSDDRPMYFFRSEAEAQAKLAELLAEPH